MPAKSMATGRWPMDIGPAGQNTSDACHSLLERLITDLPTESPDNCANTPDIQHQGNGPGGKTSR